jgi:hypothetical protein
MSSPPVHSFQLLYQAFSHGRQKDKIDTILEPLQAMIQLSLLSICPIGTKLRIQENILYVQIPNFIQPLSRWYHADRKDDLYFLYSVIKRYIKWYNPSSNKQSPLNAELYQLITTMATEGLNRLFKTYSACDANTVIHVIQMYKNLLEYNNDKILVDEYIVDAEKNKVNIDEVFERIVSVYDVNILQVVFHTLFLIQQEKNEHHQVHNMEGLNQILNKYHQSIKEWIKMNLIL